MADAVPILRLYLQFSTLLELEAAKRDPSFEWDIVDGIISGRLKSFDLPENWSVLFMLNQHNDAGNQGSEKIGWNVVSVPLASSSAEFAEAPNSIFSIFFQTGFVSKYIGNMEEEEILCEIPGKLPPTVIYRGYIHASDSVLGISTDLFGDDIPLAMDELQPEELYETRRYRTAMQKLAGGEILEAIERLDGSVPRNSNDDPELLYQALCSHNAEALASEGKTEYNALSWIAEFVQFCKCHPNNRLRGIDYGISGHPLSAEFLLKEPRNAAADWEPPVFTITVEDYDADRCDGEYNFFLSTSCSPKTFSEVHKFDGRSQRKFCAISLEQDQNIATRSEKEMKINAEFLEGLWRYCDPDHICPGWRRFFYALLAVCASVALSNGSKDAIEETDSEDSD
ncbi:hypothetical protein HDU90_001011 [Geranomyces variabilis]|nr:hypothetical protein HDU90_001011 [Geranomyces variabilis]